MEEINDGGPAFARPKSRDPGTDSYPETYPAQDGMSLRDYFAAKALQGMLGNSGYHIDGGGGGPGEYGEGSDPARFSALAYEYATAMIAERSRREAQP